METGFEELLVDRVPHDSYSIMTSTWPVMGEENTESVRFGGYMDEY